MRKLIIANWKMNPQSFAEAERLAKAIFKFTKRILSEIVLCPPFVWLTDLSHKYYREVSWGAQDTFWEKAGAFTGEISPLMLKNSKVTYVIVGHSERRSLGETDEMINKKVLAALRAGFKVILCVGEPLVIRKRGLAAAKKFVAAQLKADLKGIKGQRSRIVIAYEPIWAVGTGRADKPEETVEMARSIKQFLHSRVLYGGSVNGKNAKSFLQYKEIDGALVGGASLRLGEFKKIINASF